MDNKEIPDESIISVPSSAGNVDGTVRQDAISPTPFRNVWATVLTFTLKVVIFTIGVVRCTVIFIESAALLLLLPLYILASRWKGVFILSCVAVSFDSLFLYIPIIDEEHKCLGTDMTLRNVALALRSFTDLTFIFHIIALITVGMQDEGPKWYDSNSAPIEASGLSIRLKIAREAMTKKISWLSFSIIINFVAILPFPQVAIIVGFFRMGSSRHFFKPPIINMFLICQIFLRISQIILSIKKIDTVGKWVKCSSYFLGYFIASHVIAAFWYFFSIQREISCWDQACQTIAGCIPVYDCGHKTSLNSTFLNNLCPIDSSNATAFDFGMYLAILKSGNTGYTNFSTKFFYYFWWSLKNLSNFGTNLETSSYIWENCFAILICVIGLLLFLILIGNVQTYIQSETEKSVKIEEERRTMLDSKYKEIEKWMFIHGLPDDMKTYFWKNIRENKVVELINEDVDTEFISRSYYKSDPADKSDPLNFICINALKKVSLLRNMDEQVLNAFCKYNQSGYPDYFIVEKDSYITRAGKPLDTLCLIIDGTMEEVQTQRRLDCCGEEVLRWAILNHDKWQTDPLPKGTVDVKCLTKIGAFFFPGGKLIRILNKLKYSGHQQLFIMPLDPDISKTHRGIKDWLLRNGFPEDLKANIMKFLVEKTIDDDVDVDAVFLLGILPEHIKPSIKRHLGMNALKKVPMFQKMHKYVLEIICNHLEPVVYETNSYIIKAGEPLSFMIFILVGKVTTTYTNSSNGATSSLEITEPSNENVLERGGYYGEQLLSWASPNNIYSSDNPVKSARDVKCLTKVEALMLKAEDLKSVASRCGSQWNFNKYCMDSQQLVADGRDDVTSTTPTSTIEETIRLHQGHDIILEQLVLIRETIFRRLDDQGRRLEDQGRRLDDQGRRLDEMAAILAKVGYTGITGISSISPVP